MRLQNLKVCPGVIASSANADQFTQRIDVRSLHDALCIRGRIVGIVTADACRIDRLQARRDAPAGRYLVRLLRNIRRIYAGAAAVHTLEARLVGDIARRGIDARECSADTA